MNPLSGLTPGFLRGIFNVFDGANTPAPAEGTDNPDEAGTSRLIGPEEAPRPGAAGAIQVAVISPRKRESSARSATKKDWIPAFAGMTGNKYAVFSAITHWIS
ncbi:MAG: hypothetical protein WDN72_05635 [Alphaproteobacteria bacterium]